MAVASPERVLIHLYIFSAKIACFNKVCTVLVFKLKGYNSEVRAGELALFVTLLHSKRPKLYGVLTVLCAIGLKCYSCSWEFPSTLHSISGGEFYC